MCNDKNGSLCEVEVELIPHLLWECQFIKWLREKVRTLVGTDLYYKYENPET